MDLLLKMSEAENPDNDDALGIEQTSEMADGSKLEKEKAFMALKRQKRRRKSEMTKIRHHIEKLIYITLKDVVAIEKDIEQLWSLLENFVLFIWKREKKRTERRRWKKRSRLSRKFKPQSKKPTRP